MLSGLGTLMAGASNSQQNKANDQGMDLSMLGPLLQMVATASSGSNEPERGEPEHVPKSSGLDFENLMNLAGLFMGSNSNNHNNMNGLMGLLPMVFDALSGGGGGGGKGRSHDHSDHSWFMPPVLENIHVMWEHFRYDMKKVHY